MNFIIWIVTGGILGWLASIAMKMDAQQDILLNLAVGIVGAFLGGWLLSPRFSAGTINANDFSLMGLIVSFLWALILLAIVKLLRRSRGAVENQRQPAHAIIGASPVGKAGQAEANTGTDRHESCIH